MPDAPKPPSRSRAKKKVLDAPAQLIDAEEISVGGKRVKLIESTASLDVDARASAVLDRCFPDDDGGDYDGEDPGEQSHKILPDQNTLVFTDRCILSQTQFDRFKVEGVEFNSGQHYVEYQKACLHNDLDAMLKILQSPTPRAAKTAGGLIPTFDAPMWARKLAPTVRKSLKLRVSQSSHLREFLIGTHPYKLVFASKYSLPLSSGYAFADDEHNGNPRTYERRNLLGKFLTEIRELLIREQRHPGEKATPASSTTNAKRL